MRHDVPYCISSLIHYVDGVALRCQDDSGVSNLRGRNEDSPVVGTGGDWSGGVQSKKNPCGAQGFIQSWPSAGACSATHLGQIGRVRPHYRRHERARPEQADGRSTHPGPACLPGTRDGRRHFAGRAERWRQSPRACGVLRLASVRALRARRRGRCGRRTERGAGRGSGADGRLRGWWRVVEGRESVQD